MRKLNKIRYILILSIIFQCIPLSVTNANSAAVPEWYDFSIGRKSPSSDIINAGKIVLDAPAGKHGFVTTRDGHFYFSNGQRIRFWGVNLSYQANFPSHEEASKTANHLARSGFNIVRLHHMDSNIGSSIFEDPYNNTITLSSENLDRLDYLIYQLKEKGIYTNLNLHVSRNFTSNDGVVDADQLTLGSKYMSLFDEKAIDLQKDYAKQLLTHTNKYTGNTYANEPAIALLEITNENSIFNAWINNYIFSEAYHDKIFDKMDQKSDKLTLPEYYSIQLDKKWNLWLEEKYKNVDVLKKSWGTNNNNSQINILKNPEFEDIKSNDWQLELHNYEGANAEMSYDTNEKASGNASIKIDVKAVGAYPHMVQLYQSPVNLTSGRTYTLKFKAKSDHSKLIAVGYTMTTSPFATLGLADIKEIGTDWKEYSSTFTADAAIENGSRINIVLGIDNGSINFDDFSLIEGDNKPASEKANSEVEFGSFERLLWSDRYTCSDAVVKDNIEFYTQIEKSFFSNMLDYLKKDLKVKIPITTTNNYNGQPNLASQMLGDYMDAHNYWDHPTFSNNPWDSLDFNQTNKSFIANEGNTKNLTKPSDFFGRLSLSAVSGKPFVVSEWSHAFPNDFQYESSLAVASYALLQDWDGLFLYSYDSFGMNDNKINGWFDLATNPILLSQMPSSAIMFIRGDISPARKMIELNYSADDVLNKAKHNLINPEFGIDGELPASILFKHGVRKGSLSAKTTTKSSEVLSTYELINYLNETIHISDTQELLWDTSKPNQEYLKVDTLLSQGLSGNISGREIVTQNMEASLSQNCSLTLVSVDGNSISSSSALLLTVAGRVVNSNQSKNMLTNGLLNLGTDSTKVEKIKGHIKVKIDNSRKLAVYALDSQGNRISNINASINTEGIEFDLSGETLWYEIASR